MNPLSATEQNSCRVRNGAVGFFSAFHITELTSCLSCRIQESMERHSPPLLTVNGPGEEKLFRSKSAEVELTAEKERVKKMLSEG